MNKFKKNLLFILGIAIFTTAIGMGTKQKDVNPIDMPLLPGKTIKSYLGKKTLVVEFWASWCPYCQKQVATLNALQKKHPEIQILGIQTDDNTPKAEFKAASYSSLQVPASTVGPIMRKFGNYSGGVPFIVILDKTGKVLNTFTGETSLPALEDALK